MLVRSQRSAVATVGFIALLLLSWLIPWSKTLHPDKLADAQSLQEVSQTLPAIKQHSEKKTMSDAQLQFGVKFFSSLIKEGVRDNLMVSPTSVALALSMLYNGASGTTQQEMSQVLAIQGMNLEEINAANKALQNSLQTQEDKIQLTIANSLWARQGFSFRHQFLKTNQTVYNAQITNLDFANPEAAGIINRWVGEKTGGKIDRIIDRLNADDVLFLINAIYFKGTWQYKFDKNKTVDKPFYLTSNRSKKHPFMSREADYQYSENSDFQAVNLPYDNRRFSMYIFLPKKEKNLQNLLQRLSPNTWNQWLSQFSTKKGLLEVPRFKVVYEVELKKSLQNLGMRSAFESDKANFSQMTSEPVRVDGVKHKTFIEVNEEGTEAAAVTSIGIRATSANPSADPFRMVVDRPFFYAIRDNQTKTILFMGTLVEPK